MTQLPSQGPSSGTQFARLARVLGADFRADGFVDDRPRVGTGHPYCFVTFRLSPGDVAARAAVCIDHAVTTLGGIRCHGRQYDGAYLVPFERGGDARAEAELLWEQIMLSCVGDERNPQHLWRRGDIVMVHYPGDDPTMGCLAAEIQKDGDSLPMP